MNTFITLAMCLAVILMYSFFLVKSIDYIQTYNYFKKKGYAVEITKVQIITTAFAIIFFLLISFWIMNGFIKVLV